MCFWAELRFCLFLLPMDKICSFFGHRDIVLDLSDEVEQAVEKAINEYGITAFYVGDRGEFDRQATGVIVKLKRKYPHIKLILVLPYFTNKLNEYKELYEKEYDSVIIPSELMGAHPKSAITKRNKIMVDDSQLIICYINRNYGGAYTAVKYAEKQNKKILYIDNFYFVC